MVDVASTFDDGETVFVKQFVQDVLGFSSQYGSDVSISYTAYNVTGKPSKYPEYGDFPQAFVMRTYGKWWRECPSRPRTIMPQSYSKFESQDFIDLEFEQSVYPIRIQIFETYNPGSVIKIWAADRDHRWRMLWEGEPQHVGHKPRIFSPTIKTVNFQTRVLRLEFHHLHLDYYTELDAVLLEGTKEPWTNTKCQCRGDLPTGRLTSQILELKIHNIPPQVDISNAIYNFLGNDLSRYLPPAKNTSKNSCALKEGSSSSERSFNCLPDETILKIFGYLDLLSLSRCTQVSRHFYDLATDSLLYTELNLKMYWYCTTPATLNTLMTRCQYLQKLDLSWCGGLQVLKPHHFMGFIDQCGRQLTHLRLNSCKFVDDMCITSISHTCKNLKELALQNCVNIRDYAFRSLTLLHDLQCLDLYRTLIELGTLQEILKASPHLRHINLGSCIHVSNMDDVAITLGVCNPELVSADFWKTYSLTPLGVRALSQCHNLEEVDLGWCLGFGAPGDSLHALARGCPRLKKLFFAALRGVTDRDLEPFVEFCPLIEQIDLLGVRSISADVCESFLRTCQNLKLLDISFCDQIQDSQVTYWQQQYPEVSIKRSFQCSGDEFSNYPV